jgi:hypothetical protein
MRDRPQPRGARRPRPSFSSQPDDAAPIEHRTLGDLGGKNLSEPCFHLATSISLPTRSDLLRAASATQRSAGTPRLTPTPRRPRNPRKAGRSFGWRRCPSGDGCRAGDRSGNGRVLLLAHRCPHADTVALRAAGSSLVEMAGLAVHPPLGVGAEGVCSSGRQSDHGCALSPEEVAGVVALCQR